MEGFEPRVVEIAGVETRYFVGGEGPPLVLVHGLGGAAVNFTELAPLLAAKRRVLVPDLPGHGLSAPLASVAGMSSYALHVAAVAEHEEMLPAAVLGYSMGGVVALRLAVVRPRGVSALLLVAAAGIVSTTKRGATWIAITAGLRPGRLLSRFRHVLAGQPRLRGLPFVIWGADDRRALSAEQVLGFLEGPSQHTDVDSAGRALVADDPRPDLELVGCPVLLLWGARDRLTPLEDGFEYARRLRAPIRTLPAAGHLLVGEQPEACAAILLQYLDGIREVDELPLDAEFFRQPSGERPDA
jgi:pimeloyl-ACP methyl ester carboxylesterase